MPIQLIQAYGSPASIPAGGAPFVFDHFVATDGVASGPGLIDSPWSLAHAASGAAGNLVAGEHVGMRGGTYDVTSLSFSVSGLVGTGVNNIDKKIIFRNYAGEKVHIRGVSSATSVDDIQINGNFLWFWGLEFSRLWREKLISHTGGSAVYLNTTTDGTKFIHCTVHDGDDNFFIEPTSGAVEMYNCITYNAGNDQNPRGHNYYVQHNDSGGTKPLIIEDCIGFNTYGFLMQWFAGGVNSPRGVKVRRHMCFNPGVHNTTPNWPGFTLDNSDGIMLRCEVNDLVLYMRQSGTSDAAILIGGSGNPSIDSLDILRPYIMNASSAGAAAAVNLIAPTIASAEGSLKFKDGFIEAIGAFDVVEFEPGNGAPIAGVDWDNNQYIRDPAATAWVHSGGTAATLAAWKTATGKGANDTAQTADPTTTKVWVWANTKYEPGRGTVGYRNWAGTSRIQVLGSDLATFLTPGDFFKVWDVRDSHETSTPVTVFDAASGGNPVTVFSGADVYFPTTQVSDPALQVNSDVNIASSTDAIPIEITTASAHGYITGDTVRVANHEVNTAANGTRAITFVDATHFTINGSDGNGVGGATGIVSGKTPSTPPSIATEFNAFIVRKTG